MMEACWQNGMRCLRDMSLRSATCPLLMQVASWNIMVQVDWVMVGQAGHVRGAKAPSLGCQKKCGVIEIFVFGIVVTASTSVTWGWLRLMFLAWVHTYGLFGKGHLRQMAFVSLWAVWDLWGHNFVTTTFQAPCILCATWNSPLRSHGKRRLCCLAWQFMRSSSHDMRTSNRAIKAIILQQYFSRWLS